MERTKRILTSQTGGGGTAEIVGQAIDAAKSLKDTVNQQTTKNAPNSNGVAPLDQSIEQTLIPYQQSEQAASEQFSTFGLDQSVLRQYVQALVSVGMPNDQTVTNFIQNLASIATQSSVDISKLFPIAVSIFSKTKDTQRALTILSVLGSYESKWPGLGIFDIAGAAAAGKPFANDLLFTRIGLMSHDNLGMNATKDLEQAIAAIASPNTPLSAELDAYKSSKLKAQQAQIQFILESSRYKAQWAITRNKFIEHAYESLTQHLPGLVHNPIIQLYIKYLESIASVSAIKSTLGTALASPAPQQHTPQPGMGFIQPRGAEVTRTRKILTAQTAGVAPSSLLPPSGGAMPAPGPGAPATTAPAMPPSGLPGQVSNAGQQAQQMIQGTDFQNNQQFRQMSAQEYQLSNTFNQQQILFKQTQEAFNQAYNNLVGMLNPPAGDTESTGRVGEKPIIPLINPEELAAQSQSVNNLGLQAYNEISQMLQILQQLVSVSASSGNALSQANYTNQLTYFRSEAVAIKQKRANALALSIVGPIELQIRLLEQQKEYHQQGMEFAFNNMNGIGADQHVGPFSGICMQMAQLHKQAAQKYLQVAAGITGDPGMQQALQQKARVHMVSAYQARNEGSSAIMKMTGNIFGSGNMGSGITALTADSHNRMSRLAEEDLERDADKELEDYWNDLYDDSLGSPNYGTELEHPRYDKNKAQITIDKLHKMRKKHRKVNLAD